MILHNVKNSSLIHLSTRALLFILLLGLGFVLAQISPAERVFKLMLEAEQSLEIIGEVSETINFPPRNPATRRAERFSQPPNISPGLIRRNFNLSLAGDNMIADRPVIGLDLIPKNGLSPRWRLWLDRGTGLRLAYEQRNALGEVLSEGRYERVRSIRARPTVRAINPPELNERSRNTLTRLLGRRDWPPGFIPVKLERSNLRGRPALRITAWDGLNGLLLLIYPSRDSNPEGRYIRSVQAGRLTLSVLSPLPADALDSWLQRLAEPLIKLSEEEISRLFDSRP